MGKLGEAKWFLLGGLTTIVVLTVGSLLTPSRLIGAVDWVANSDLARRVRALTGPASESRDSMIEVVVDGLRASLLDRQPVLILREKSGERYLPIWIGVEEARAIEISLERVSTPRPLTVDLLHSVLNTLDADVRFIVIDDLRDDVFYAKVVVAMHGRAIEIDSRPSDAIALGLRQGAPIYVEEKVLNKAGVVPDRKGDILT